MDWEMFYMDASKLIWIGNGLCTLCTMETSHRVIVALHNARVSNGEIVPHCLD